MLAPHNHLTIGKVIGPKTGILHHIRIDLIHNVEDDSRQVHVYVTDIYNKHINEYKKVLAEDEFTDLLNNKIGFDNLIKDVVTQSEV